MEDEKASVDELIKKRKLVEDEIKALQAVLKSQGMGMADSLTDSEGFPRNDVDVYTVRNARKTIICLQTDHKDLTSQIEKGIHLLHSLAKENKTPPDLSIKLADDELKVFLLVDVVTDGSPAHQAGMAVDDKVLKFGSITAKNFDGLQSIAKIVQQSKGRNMPVVVERGGSHHHLTLCPSEWSGRGLLGCNIVHIK